MIALHDMPRGVVLRTAALLFAAIAVTACGGSSPTTPNPPPIPPPVVPRVTFVADDASTGADEIVLSLGAATQTTFDIIVNAAFVTDLYGYGVDVTFDPTVVMFDTFEAGTFFDGSGVAVTTQVTEGPSGTLVIGQTRVGPVPGVSGSGTLVTLKFKALIQGTSVFATAKGGTFDSTGSALVTAFFGGTATVPVQPTQPGR